MEPQECGMIIQMKPGLRQESKEVQQVLEKATQWKVRPEAEVIKGTEYHIVSIRLYDGERKSRSIPDHIFDVMEGVDQVIRVTPPEISLSHTGQSDARVIKLSPTISISNHLPCRLVFGPCTVDKYIDIVLRDIVQLGIKTVRGGCWKPRSSPYSFDGFGEKGVEWLLGSAAKHGVETVFLEIMETGDIDIVRRIQNEVGYTGTIVLWVGARTRNTRLLRKLGSQNDYPVMLKHGLQSTTPEDFAKDAEWIVNGPVEFDGEGVMIKERSSKVGNSNIILCLRGQEPGQKPWRYRTNWDWAEHIRQNWWTPVAIDPSHAAGTMEGDLVMTSIRSALTHNPALLIVEGGYPEKGFNGDGFRGLCDMAQSIPIERAQEVINLVREHNKRVYGQDVF